MKNERLAKMPAGDQDWFGTCVGGWFQRGLFQTILCHCASGPAVPLQWGCSPRRAHPHVAHPTCTIPTTACRSPLTVYRLQLCLRKRTATSRNYKYHCDYLKNLNLNHVNIWSYNLNLNLKVNARYSLTHSSGL